MAFRFAAITSGARHRCDADAGGGAGGCASSRRPGRAGRTGATGGRRSAATAGRRVRYSQPFEPADAVNPAAPPLAVGAPTGALGLTAPGIGVVPIQENDPNAPAILIQPTASVSQTFTDNINFVHSPRRVGAYTIPLTRSVDFRRHATAAGGIYRQSERHFLRPFLKPQSAQRFVVCERVRHSASGRTFRRRSEPGDPVEHGTGVRFSEPVSTALGPADPNLCEHDLPLSAEIV